MNKFLIICFILLFCACSKTAIKETKSVNEKKHQSTISVSGYCDFNDDFTGKRITKERTQLERLKDSVYDQLIIGRENIKDGALDGICKYSYLGLTYKYLYRGGLRDGRAAIYDGGKLVNKIQYSSGFFNGKYLGWYPYGVFKVKANFSVGLLSGTVLEWYSNGQLSRQLNYVNGFLNGEEWSWNEDGKVNYKAEYESDVLKSVTFWRDAKSYNVYNDRGAKKEIKYHLGLNNDKHVETGITCNNYWHKSIIYNFALSALNLHKKLIFESFVKNP